MTKAQTGSSNIEIFKEEMEKNIEFIGRHYNELDAQQDVEFAKNLYEFYNNRGYLTDKQIYYMTKFWSELNEAGIVD